MTKDALSIVKQAIAAVNPYTAVQSHVNADNGRFQVGSKEYSANSYDTVLVVSFGKASSAMAMAVVERIEECMPNLPIQGVVICKDDHATKGRLILL